MSLHRISLHRSQEQDSLLDCIDATDAARHLALAAQLASIQIGDAGAGRSAISTTLDVLIEGLEDISERLQGILNGKGAS